MPSPTDNAPKLKILYETVCVACPHLIFSLVLLEDETILRCFWRSQNSREEFVNELTSTSSCEINERIFLYCIGRYLKYTSFKDIDAIADKVSMGFRTWVNAKKQEEGMEDVILGKTGNR